MHELHKLRKQRVQDMVPWLHELSAGPARGRMRVAP
jgi:hypothetical protein